MTKPASLQPLEELFGLDFVFDETNDPAIFGRYGRREADACRYWMRGDVVAGLCVRGSSITSTEWLNDPELADLEVLLLGENNFTDLVIPAGMTKLQHLDLNASPELTSVRFAGSPPRLRRLEATDCSELTAFVVPSDCPDLHYFDLNGCALTSFALDGDFSSLVYLDLSKSPELQEFSLAGNFASLLSLHLRAAAQLETLSLRASLPALDTLDLHGTNVSELPANLILGSSLYRLYAHGSAPKNCPAAFLQDDDNVLANVRSWFQALKTGSEKNRIVKLLINGNGNVGKSTLWCALKNKKESACTCADHETTHGIDLTVEVLALDEVDFRGWDFGGQEIYQGTHRLFLTDGAVQVLVLDYESEQAAINGDKVPDRSNGDTEAPDKWVHNFPLEQFYTRQKTLGPRSKFLIVQTKKALGHDRHPAALKLDKEADLTYEFLDAKKPKGVRRLREDLQDLAKELPIYGMLFPSSWLEVRQWLAGVLKANDTAAEPLRVIDRTNFRTKVVKDFGITDDDQMIEALLIFLHAAGDVYVNKEHLKNQIIIDLSWALEGIYRPLQRGKFLDAAKGANGRLFVDTIYPNTFGSERALFLEFMQSCGMCFPADREIDQRAASEYYIFPAFLREQPDHRVQRIWKLLPTTPTWSATLPYRDLPAIHALICDLGRKTTEGQLWHSGIDLSLVDTRDREVDKAPLPEANAKIELTDAKEGEQGCQLVVTLDSPEAAAWLPSIQGWVGEHFSGLDWQANEVARTQVQEEVLKSRGGETFAQDDLQDQIATEPVAVWFVAHPLGTEKLSFNTELGLVKSRMSALSSVARIEPAVNATFQSLRDRCKKHAPKVIHFIGHGTVNDTLVFHEENGPGQVVVPAAKFQRQLEMIRKYAPLEVVVLNACFSSEFAREISRPNLYVIGTEDSLKNEVASAFAADFYGHYYQVGVSVADAFLAGIEFVYTEHGSTCEDYRLFYNGEDITPKLYG